jgi:hypothetical protein
MMSAVHEVRRLGRTALAVEFSEAAGAWRGFNTVVLETLPQMSTDQIAAAVLNHRETIRSVKSPRGHWTR